MPEAIRTDDTIATLLMKRPSAARVLLNHRMHCVGCDIARFETLAEACTAYGIAADDFLAELDSTAARDYQEQNS